jgi:DNA-binding CsgD family transcriptional regulator
MLAVAILLVDASGRLIYQNRAAISHIKRGSLLRVNRRHLGAFQPAANERLLAAIGDVAAGTHGSSLDIALTCGAGEGVLATVSNLASDASSPGSSLVAIVFTDPDETRKQLLTTFGEMYGLTASEVLVLQGLASGATKSEIANDGGTAVATISTHLSRTLNKTGTARQSALIMLYQSHLTPLLPVDSKPERPGDQPEPDGPR